jgi:hypothetical protein
LSLEEPVSADSKETKFMQPKMSGELHLSSEFYDLSSPESEDVQASTPVTKLM